MIVNTVFFLAQFTSQNKDQKNPKIKKSAKSWISKPKRVKINTIWLDDESKGHNVWKKNHFIVIEAKTLTRYGKKLTFWSNRWIVLNFGPSCRAYFSLWNDSSRANVTPQTQKGSKHEERTIKRETVGDFSLLFCSTR